MFSCISGYFGLSPFNSQPNCQRLQLRTAASPAQQLFLHSSTASRTAVQPATASPNKEALSNNSTRYHILLVFMKKGVF
jgi:hypothetical protein